MQVPLHKPVTTSFQSSLPPSVASASCCCCFGRHPLSEGLAAVSSQAGWLPRVARCSFGVTQSVQPFTQDVNQTSRDHATLCADTPRPGWAMESVWCRRSDHGIRRVCGQRRDALPYGTRVRLVGFVVSRRVCVESLDQGCDSLAPSPISRLACRYA